MGLFGDGLLSDEERQEKYKNDHDYSKEQSSESIVVGVRLDSRIIEFLKKKAASFGVSGNHLTYNGLIRHAILDQYKDEIENYLLNSGFDSFKDGFSYEDFSPISKIAKEDWVQTDEGRVSISNVMCKSIEEFVSKNSFARKILIADELPCGAFGRYAVGQGAGVEPGNSTAISSVDFEDVLNNDNYFRAKKSQEEIVPTEFELLSMINIRLSEVKSRRYKVVDRVSFLSAVNMVVKEEVQLWGLLTEITKSEKVCAMIIEDLADMLKQLIDSDIEENWTISMNGEVFALLNTHLPDIGFTLLLKDANKNSRCEIAATHNNGKISIVNTCPANKIFFLPKNEELGAMPIRQGITVLPADDPRKLLIGWIVYEEIGMFAHHVAKCFELTN